MTPATTRIVTVIAAFIAGLGAFSIAIFLIAGRGPLPITAPSAIGGPFRLVDQNGAVVTEDALKGKPSIVFFGFTERDTPDVLKEYLSSFDPRLRGLTGDPKAVAAIEKAYRVYSKKVPLDAGGYTMDHTALVYLMGKDGSFIGAFNIEQTPAQAAAEWLRHS